MLRKKQETSPRATVGCLEELTRGSWSFIFWEGLRAKNAHLEKAGELSSSCMPHENLSFCLDDGRPLKSSEPSNDRQVIFIFYKEDLEVGWGYTQMGDKVTQCHSLHTMPGLLNTSNST